VPLIPKSVSEQVEEENKRERELHLTRVYVENVHYNEDDVGVDDKP